MDGDSAVNHCPICFEWIGNRPHSHPAPAAMTPMPISVWEEGFEKELVKAEARGYAKAIAALHDEAFRVLQVDPDSSAAYEYAVMHLEAVQST